VEIASGTPEEEAAEILWIGSASFSPPAEAFAHDGNALGVFDKRSENLQGQNDVFALPNNCIDRYHVPRGVLFRIVMLQQWRFLNKLIQLVELHDEIIDVLRSSHDILSLVHSVNTIAIVQLDNPALHLQGVGEHLQHAGELPDALHLLYASRRVVQSAPLGIGQGRFCAPVKLLPGKYLLPLLPGGAQSGMGEGI